MENDEKDFILAEEADAADEALGGREFDDEDEDEEDDDEAEAMPAAD
jgi:hypothetical protein